MIQQISLPFLTLSSLLNMAELCADWHGTVLLYSGGHLDSAKNSFLALCPYESATVVGHKLDHQKGNIKETFDVQNPWDGLQHHFFDPLEAKGEAMAFGWLGYGMGAFADKERSLPYRPSDIPDAYWQRCAVVFRFDHSLNEACMTVDALGMEKIDRKTARWIEALTSPEAWERLESGRDMLSPNEKGSQLPLPFVDCPKRRLSYMDKISSVQGLIRAGEVYQVNLSQKFHFESERHPFSLFREICRANPAPFSAYFRHRQTAVVSSSPERFLCKKGRQLETRPIKGTIQRGETEEEDCMLKASLLSSPKERAELLMITDLMRNDLGKISLPGTVETIDLWRCEAYANVFHLISIIRSTAKAELKPLEIVRECFPGGSVTGCPKMRAMEIIDSLEKRPRGIYTGSIGYFTGQGDFDLNVAIRTLVSEGNQFSLQLGGGIVIDSERDKEYREIIYKGASFFNLLQRILQD